MESDGRSFGAFGSNLALVAMRMFPHLIYLLSSFINVVLSIRFSKIMLQ
jgi:hypothetical protein